MPQGGEGHHLRRTRLGGGVVSLVRVCGGERRPSWRRERLLQHGHADVHRFGHCSTSCTQGCEVGERVLVDDGRRRRRSLRIPRWTCRYLRVSIEPPSFFSLGLCFRHRSLDCKSCQYSLLLIALGK